MYAVQKKDPWGNWVEVYRAQSSVDAEQFQKNYNRGKNKNSIRIIKI